MNKFIFNLDQDIKGFRHIEMPKGVDIYEINLLNIPGPSGFRHTYGVKRKNKVKRVTDIKSLSYSSEALEYINKDSFPEKYQELEAANEQSKITWNEYLNGGMKDSDHEKSINAINLVNKLRSELDREFSCLLKDEHMFVRISDSEYVRASDVTFVPSTHKPAAKISKPNTRQLMVDKSVWRFTKDVDVFYKDDNKTLKLFHSCKTGDEFTVVGKFNSFFNPHGWDGEYYSNVCMATFDGSTEVGLEYKQIADSIEAVSIPLVKVYVLRNKSTGNYYTGYRYGTFEHEESNSFMKAPTWKNIGVAKTQVLSLTGYFVGLENHYDTGFNLSTKILTYEDWELVEFDKLQRQELQVIDLDDWYKRTWELRSLTVKFGSSVRGIFADIEKSKDHTKYECVIRFGHSPNTDWLDEDTEIGPINTAMTGIKSKKKKDDYSICFAVESIDDALIAKLRYDGDLKVDIIKIETLEEVVDGED